MDATDEEEPVPGKWTRLRGCTYSHMCRECESSPDTPELALRRQHKAAGGDSAPKMKKRRLTLTFASDMKGLSQMTGHAGQSSTYFCVLCYAKLMSPP